MFSWRAVIQPAPHEERAPGEILAPFLHFESGQAMGRKAKPSLRLPAAGKLGMTEPEGQQSASVWIGRYDRRVGGGENE
jgi:hypothetical protein